MLIKADFLFRTEWNSLSKIEVTLAKLIEMKKITLIFMLFISISTGFSQVLPAKKKAKTSKSELIYADRFEKDLQNWQAEFEQPETSSMILKDGKMDVSTSRGATIWFKHKLSGNVVITYTVRAIDAGGANDRGSDLNVFWMATDPANENLFTRKGKFSEYDNLNLYYVGVGGHDNTTTRFRKYEPGTEKPVLKEYTDQEHLLTGNKDYHIRIKVKNGQTQYYLNDVLYFDLKDTTPYSEGYFGFRTTNSHQQFSDFKIRKIE